MFYTIVEILFCIVDITFLHIFLEMFLTKKTFKHRVSKYINILLWGLVLHEITYVNLFCNYSNLLCLISIIVYGVLSFEGKIQNKIILGIIFNIFLGSMITIVLNIAAVLSTKTISEMLTFSTVQRILTVIGVKAVVFSIIKAVKYFLNHFKIEIPKKYKYMLVAIFITTFVGIGTIFETSILNNNPFINKLMLLITVSFIIFNIVIFILLQGISNFIHEKATTSIILNNQVNLEKHILELDNKQKEIKKIRHDMLNHYGILEYLIENENKEESLEYLRSLRAVFESTSNYYKTGNYIADAVINQVINKNKQYNIQFNMQIYIPPVIQMEPMDLGAILSNLLDNAIEAVREIENNSRKININIHPHNEKLLIDISNSVMDNPIKDGVLIRRQKEHYNEHGYGMKSIQYVVDKYSGYMSYKCENSIFNITILLNCKSEIEPLRQQIV